MKAWDSFWSKFEDTMAELPAAIDEFIEDCTSNKHASSLTFKDGVVIIKGRIDKLVINGRTIRLPKEVTEGM